MAIPEEPLYQNVWTTSDYVYHTTGGGIQVYNNDTSAVLSTVLIPGAYTEFRFTIVFNKVTPLDDFSVLVTLSPGDTIYSYTTTGDDIHFRDANDVECGFWIESWVYNGTSTIWVKPPDAGTSYVNMDFGNTQGVTYSGGAPNDGLWFYDDFTTVYPGATGLGPDWATDNDSYFLVSGNKLRVNNATSYPTAYIATDKGFGFTPPIRIEMSVSNISTGGSASYNQCSTLLTGGAQGTDGWSWYGNGSYDRRLWFTGTASWKNGTNAGFNTSNFVTETYIGYNKIRVNAIRSSTPWDATWYGTTRTIDSQLTLFQPYNADYDCNYVRVRKWDDTGDVLGTISGSNIPIFNYNSSSPSSVWADDTNIFIGTVGSGIYQAPVSLVGVSGTIMSSLYKGVPDITDNSVTYIHGAGDYLCATTSSGVDLYTVSSGTRMYTFDENIHKCFQTSSGTLYYIENNSLFDDENSPLLGGSLKDWTYYQVLTTSPTPTDDSQVVVRFDNISFPYHHTKTYGEDVRFIDQFGINLKYYIEDWYPEGVIRVNVDTAGTDTLYMLYGNANAAAQSDIEGAYYFIDQFEGTTLDTTVWQANTRGDGVVSVQDGYVRLYDYDNGGTEIITKAKLPYGLRIEASVRRNGGTDTTQFDFVYGYTTVTTGRSMRGYTQCDIIAGVDDFLHRLVPYWAGSVQGTGAMQSYFSTYEFLMTDGYQRSVYLDEILEATASGIDTENHLIFHINNSSANPDLNIEWVRASTWPEITVTLTQELVLWDLISPRLHAVYTPASSWMSADYVYEDFLGSPIYLNDIHVTEETSAYNNDNTIFLATDIGAHVIEERKGNEENSNWKRYYIK